MWNVKWQSWAVDPDWSNTFEAVQSSIVSLKALVTQFLRIHAEAGVAERHSELHVQAYF